MPKNKKAVIFLNILLALWICTGTVFYLKQYSILLKGLISAGFALMGLINLFYSLSAGTENKKFHILMAAGLVFACGGDIVLHYDFLWGALLFALGHVGFFVACCMLKKLRFSDILAGLAVFAAAGSFILFSSRLDFGSPVMKALCMGYALIISLMLGKATANFFSKPDTVTALVFAGSALFCFSDVMLMLDWFSVTGRIVGILCIAAYYPSEIILALSSFFAAKKKV